MSSSSLTAPSLAIRSHQHLAVPGWDGFRIVTEVAGRGRTVRVGAAVPDTATRGISARCARRTAPIRWSSAEQEQMLAKRNWISPRKAIVAALALGLIGGAILVSTSLADDDNGDAFPLEVGSDGRYLVDQAGRPFLYTADTSWTLLSKLSVADAKRYIDIRKSQGFNTIQTNLITWFRFESGARGSAFEDDDLARPNEAYWAGVDEIIDYAAAQQMLLSIGIMWLASNGGWDNSNAPTTSEMTQYAAWVGERYRDRSNIIWFMGGDEQPHVLTSLTAAGGRALQSADPNHLITYHPNADAYLVRDEDWLSFNSFQRNFNDPPYPYQLVREGSELAPDKPILDIEPPYEPDPCCGTDRLTSPQENRRAGWWAILSGTLGVVYGGPQYGSWNIGDGGNVDWNGTTREPPRHTANIRKILEALPWYKLVTDWDHRVVTDGRGTYGDADYAIAGRATDGSLVAVYMPTAREVTVDLEQLSGTVTTRWVDPVRPDGRGRHQVEVPAAAVLEQRDRRRVGAAGHAPRRSSHRSARTSVGDSTPAEIGITRSPPRSTWRRDRRRRPRPGGPPRRRSRGWSGR